MGSLKLDVDTSVFAGEHSFSIGMVLRDHQEQFICGKCMNFAGRVSVLEVELVGILEDLLWRQDFPEQFIILESDSLLSVNANNKAVKNHLELGDLIEQCRYILDIFLEVGVL